MQGFEAALLKLLIGYAIWGLIGFLVTLVAIYYVVKSAIRDGIDESTLPDQVRYVGSALARRNSDTAHEMRADR